MITMLAGIAVLLGILFVGFKVARFVASVVLKMVLLVILLGVAAFVFFRMT